MLDSCLKIFHCNFMCILVRGESSRIVIVFCFVSISTNVNDACFEEEGLMEVCVVVYQWGVTGLLPLQAS